MKRHCRGFEDLLIAGSHPTQTIKQGKRQGKKEAIKKFVQSLETSYMQLISQAEGVRVRGKINDDSLNKAKRKLQSRQTNPGRTRQLLWGCRSDLYVGDEGALIGSVGRI